MSLITAYLSALALQRHFKSPSYHKVFTMVMARFTLLMILGFSALLHPVAGNNGTNFDECRARIEQMINEGLPVPLYKDKISNYDPSSGLRPIALGLDGMVNP